MYTLDIKKVKITYLIISIICVIFSSIYEYFSHGVYSIYMLVPGSLLFIMGFILVPLMSKLFDRISFNLYNSFLACLLTGSYIKGILDIFGTTNDLIYVYLIADIIFLLLTIIFIVRGRIVHE